MELSSLSKDRLADFARDVLILSRIWGKSVTVTVSVYTFTASSGAAGSIQKKCGNHGLTRLADVVSFPSGLIEVQWLVTSQST